ncbi:hypothetical protein ELI44_36965 [Rhizobium ruizarguesonis]|uniref:nSTAND3 domain-containing NTPase n=1 Tax=Rhizobium ruizarguesonis TaxID=2081791 RepID=UPI0010323715|nr:restriction endonuclease [Rhizobium ruizarguesonis]TAU38907.1 hypothetical protein ELI42_32865 [Rhizobium ruizarguesonis]TAU45904.1 hypothetical protein ELI44_36965 [Rhizobium ruizarguesonis]
MSQNYDFRTLSPLEFEAFCINLTAAELGLPFETFAEGRDRGIDGRYEHEGRTIIVQAKHFRNSTWAKLEKAAEDESRNLKILNPDRYIFTTSQPLSPDRKDKLKAALDHRSVSVGDIWGQTELNALLQKHPDVERRNIKLWMSSTEVLRTLLNNHIIVASQAILFDIKRTMKIYVATRAVGQALETLDKRRCLIISGPPGAGKTTLSQVLAAKHVSEGWKLVSIMNVEDGWRAFQEDERQLFLFDDFLGKIDLERSLSGNEQESLNKFFQHVGRSTNKRLILTSRSYILEAAREKSETLDEVRVRLAEQVLQLSAYSRVERGLILYNHLYHSDIDDKAIEALIDSNCLGRIIDHRNYMPRLIEWMTDRLRVNDVAPEDYPAAFIATLENPTKIWEKPFRHISKQANVLLFSLFASDDFMSFRGNGVSFARLMPFFCRALRGFGLTSGDGIGGNALEETLREINSSFVTVHEGRVNFVNPSLQDFLKTRICDSNILAVLIAASGSHDATVRLWNIARSMPADIARDLAAKVISSIRSGWLAGKMQVSDFFDLIDSLGSKSHDWTLVDDLRRSNWVRLTWNPADLPAFISKLQHYHNPNIPEIATYVRFFYRELFQFVKNSPSLRELTLLAENLTEHPIATSQAFKALFKKAATLEIESLEIPDREDETGRLAEDWLKAIDKIENYLPLDIEEKKNELDQFVDSWHTYLANRSGDYLSGSIGSARPDYRSADQSDAILTPLFQDLKTEVKP